MERENQYSPLRQSYRRLGVHTSRSQQYAPACMSVVRYHTEVDVQIHEVLIILNVSHRYHIITPPNSYLQQYAIKEYGAYV